MAWLLLRRCVLVIVLAGSAALASPARADYRIDGHGYGHGVGLAQYGAMGIARETRHTYRWILSRYFPGTRRVTGPSARIRVRLKQATAARVALATLARDARGRRVILERTHVYRFLPWRADGLTVTDRTTGRTRARLRAPVRLTGPAPMRVVGKAENGVENGRYRGAIVLRRAAAMVLVVDDVRLESYLRGVVPAEMPASWRAQALRAQSVVARCYALTSRRLGEPFDVFADTRSQVYRGVGVEHPRTDGAVKATRAIVLIHGASVARTLFHSSSGGRTASADEVFGGPPVPYLRSVEDPFDRGSPYHDWTVTLTDAQAARQLATVLRGDLLDVQVVARTPSGRAASMRVTGTLGSVDVPGVTARTLLGLRSSWFTVRRGTTEPVP
jgi:stage II sporulation protein D